MKFTLANFLDRTICVKILYETRVCDFLTEQIWEFEAHLLPQNRLGLTTETLLLTVITSTTLGEL